MQKITKRFFLEKTKSIRGFVLLTLIMMCAHISFGQSNPTAQSIPYTQAFASFTGTTPAYPSGWQGWDVAGSLSASYLTTAPSGDRAVTVLTNTTSTRGIFDMIGKLGIGSTGNAISSPCLAINTTNLTSIVVSFKAGTQRTENTRLNELGLQYRVGTSGVFTNVSGSTYQNQLTPTNTTGTGAVNVTSVSVTLPVAAEKVAVVQLRWIIRDVSGSGNRPTFSIDDISVTGTASGPTITGAATATAFTTTYGVASAVQSFAVSAIGLTENLIATAPTGFEVANGAGSYGSTATFTQSGGSTSGTLNVRLAATAAVGGTYNGQNIVLSSTGATSSNIVTSANGNTVSTKALTITASTQSKSFGATSPTTGVLDTTFTVSGLVNSETATSATLGYSGSGNLDTARAGTYTITPSALVFSGLISNYNPTYTSGTLTINAIVPTAPSITSVTAGNQNLSVAFTAPSNDGGANITNYEYSTNGGSNFTAVSPAQTTSPILISSLTNGNSYNVQLKAVNSAGAGEATTTTQGTPEAPASPTISASVNSISARSTTYGTASTSTSFTLSGATLSAGITVTPPSGFEVSTSLDFLSNVGNNGSPLVIGAAPTVSTTTVYVRLMATAGVSGTYNNQNIVLTTTDATTVNVTTAASGNTVSPKALTMSGLTGVGREYDATTTATVSDATSYIGLENGETFSVTGSPGYVFASKAIGLRAITASGYTAPSENYTVSQPTVSSATITAATLTITSPTATNRPYDATTDVTVSGTLSGILESDTVTLSTTGTIVTATAGPDKAVTFSISGADAGNYTLTQPGTTVNITQASQTITFDQALTYTTATATFGLTGTASSGLSVTYTSSNPLVATVSGSTVTILSVGTSTITAIQAGDTNYAAATSVARTLTVTAAPVTVYYEDFGSSSTVSTTYTSGTNATGSVILATGVTTPSWAQSIASANFAGVAGGAMSATVPTLYTITSTIPVSAGYLFTPSSIGFSSRITSTGPTTLNISISGTGGSTTVAAYTLNRTNSFVTVPAQSFVNTALNLSGSATLTFSYSGSGGGNARLDNVTLAGFITCATPSAPTASNSAVTYDGNAKSVTASVGVATTVDWYAAASGGSAVLSGSLTSPANTNAGTYTYYAEARNTASGCSLVSASRTAVVITISKATPTATLTISNSPILYTGSGLSATVGISASLVPGTVTTISTGGAATQTAAGSYAVTASFVPTDAANYNTLTGLLAGNFVISDTTVYTTSWDLGAPTSAVINAVITGNLSSTGSLSAKNLTVNGTLTVATGSFTVAEALVNNGTITVQNNANMIQTAEANTNSGSGTAIVNRNSAALKRLDFTMWSSPVLGPQKLEEFSPNTSRIPNRFYTYDSLNNVYANVATTSTFTPGRGYLIRMPNDASTSATPYAGQFTGTSFNNGTVTLSSLTAENFYLVGNPYPSTISANSFLTANPGTLYFWRKTNGASGSAYATYNGTGAASPAGSEVPNGTIQVGQGFIAKTGVADTDLVFTNAMRLGTVSTQFFKTKKVTEKSRVWLNLTNTGGVLSQTLVGYLDGATLGVDNGYDGKYINDSAIALTSIVDGGEYTIQGRPAFDATDVVALGFKTDVAGDYTIALNSFDGLFAAGQDVYLVDAVTGNETDLKTGSYNFIATAGVNNARFSLKYQKTLKVDAPAFNDNSVKVYKNNGRIVVNSTAKTIKTIAVYDVQGRLIAKQMNVNASTATINNLKDIRQMLIVKVSADDNSVVSKKVLN